MTAFHRDVKINPVKAKKGRCPGITKFLFGGGNQLNKGGIMGQPRKKKKKGLGDSSQRRGGQRKRRKPYPAAKLMATRPAQKARLPIAEGLTPEKKKCGQVRQKEEKRGETSN